jgi:hypothetical protein
MRTSMLVLVLAVAGCGADTATVEEACQQLAHCSTLGPTSLEACAARYTAAGWSGECYGAIAGTECQEMSSGSWVPSCAEPCYESGADRCLPGEYREICMHASVDGLYWMPGDINCNCPDGWAAACDPANPNACTCDPA